MFFSMCARKERRDAGKKERKFLKGCQEGYVCAGILLFVHVFLWIQLILIVLTLNLDFILFTKATIVFKVCVDVLKNHSTFTAHKCAFLHDSDNYTWCPRFGAFHTAIISSINLALLLLTTWFFILNFWIQFSKFLDAFEFLW